MTEAAEREGVATVVGGSHEFQVGAGEEGASRAREDDAGHLSRLGPGDGVAHAPFQLREAGRAEGGRALGAVGAPERQERDVMGAAPHGRQVGRGDGLGWHWDLRLIPGTAGTTY